MHKYKTPNWEFYICAIPRRLFSIARRFFRFSSLRWFSERRPQSSSCIWFNLCKSSWATLLVALRVKSALLFISLASSTQSSLRMRWLVRIFEVLKIAEISVEEWLFFHLTFGENNQARAPSSIVFQRDKHGCNNGAPTKVPPTCAGYFLEGNGAASGTLVTAYNCKR